MPVVSGLRRTVLAPAAVLVLPAYLSACFHYVPVNVPPLPKPQAEVRVTLAKPLDIAMGEFTLNKVSGIEGIVAAADADTLGLVARWLYPRGGQRYDALYGSYGIPLSGIEQLEEWRFSARRTAILLGVGAVTVGVFFSLARRGLSSQPPPPPPPDVTSIMGPR